MVHDGFANPISHPRGQKAGNHPAFSLLGFSCLNSLQDDDIRTFGQRSLGLGLEVAPGHVPKDQTFDLLLLERRFHFYVPKASQS